MLLVNTMALKPCSKCGHIEQLDEEDKQVIYRMIDTMLTKKKFQDFFQQNVAR